MRNPNCKCEICETPVYRRPFELKKADGKAFCSKKCYGFSCRKPAPCVTCGTEILASENKKTCSKECFAALTQSPNRNHSLGRRRVDKVKWGTRTFRKRFLEDRGTSCEVCGYDRTPVLTIHHVIERCNGGSDDYDNLLLLCRNCHGEIHMLGKFMEGEPGRRTGTVC